MDKRIEKTKYAIKKAFMELRKKKPFEKITVKELCELAYINKSTFYSHYEDIYALSDAMEMNILLSYCIHGAYNASLSNPNADPKVIIQVLEKAVKALQPLY